ncbi:MAG: MFS transporter [Victivallales bacterium]
MSDDMSGKVLNVGSRAWLRRVELSVLAAMGSIYMLAFFHRVAVPGTIFNQLQMDFNMTASAVAAVGAVFLYTYGLSQFLIGPVVDRFGGMKVLIFGGAMMSIGCFTFAMSGTPAMLYFSRVILALGSATMFLCIVKEIDRMFGAWHFTMLLSIMLFMGGLGGVFGTAPFDWSVTAFGWRKTLMAVGVITTLSVVAVAILYLIVAKKLPPEKISAGGGSYMEVVRNPSNIPVILAGCVNYATYLVMQSVIGKKFLEDYLGAKSSTAALCTMAMMATLMLLMPVVGFASQLIGNRRKLVIVPSVILAAIAVSGMLGGVWFGNKSLAYYMCCMIALAVSASSNPVVPSSIKELNHPDAVGKSVGFYNGMLYVVIALSVNAAGLIMDQFKDAAVVTSSAVVYPASAYVAVFSCLFGMALISMVSSFFIRETFGACHYPDSE